MALQIGNVKIGMDQIKEPSSAQLKTLANGFIFMSTIVGLLLAPMPKGWIPNDLRVYVLTVLTTTSGFLKGLEKASSIAPPNPTVAEIEQDSVNPHYTPPTTKI